MNLKVWADGLGVWHASVPLSGNRHKDALAARRLIIEALEERYAPNFNASSVSVTRERITGHGTAVYRETSR